jgi:hypothetical protein
MAIWIALGPNLLLPDPVQKREFAVVEPLSNTNGKQPGLA